MMCSLLPFQKNVRPEGLRQGDYLKIHRFNPWHRKALVRRETRQAPEAEGSNESGPVQARPQSHLSDRVRELLLSTEYMPHNFRRHYFYPRLISQSLIGPLAEPTQTKLSPSFLRSSVSGVWRTPPQDARISRLSLSPLLAFGPVVASALNLSRGFDSRVSVTRCCHGRSASSASPFSILHSSKIRLVFVVRWPNLGGRFLGSGSSNR